MMRPKIFTGRPVLQRRAAAGQHGQRLLPRAAVQSAEPAAGAAAGAEQRAAQLPQHGKE